MSATSVIEKFIPRDLGPKTWGRELLVAHTEQYIAKVLWMRAGTSGPLQYHEQKDETFFLLSGRAQVKYRNDQGEFVTVVMLPGDAYHVPPMAPHQVAAIDDCVFVEGSTPVFNDRVQVRA